MPEAIAFGTRPEITVAVNGANGAYRCCRLWLSGQADGQKPETVIAGNAGRQSGQWVWNGPQPGQGWRRGSIYGHARLIEFASRG
jgi:hypothetical protein